MNRSYRPLGHSLLFGAAIAAVCVLPAPVRAQEGQIISEIVVEGAKATNPQAVVLTSGVKVGDVYRNDALLEARKAVREKGLYASVVTRTETTPDKKLRLIFEIIENPVVANVIITGNRSIPTKTLTDLISIKPNEVLNTKVLRADTEKIIDLYREKGYIAFIGDELGVDAKTQVLTIPVIESVIENITVTGLRKTKPFVVTREFRTKPGEVYNENIAKRDARRVFNLGLFSDIGPIRPLEGSELGKVLLNVPVVEARTGQVGVVFGYSTRQRLTGTLELSENNFRGRGEGLNLQWTVGGLAARNAFEVGFSEPYIDSQRTSLAVSVYDRVLYRFNRIFTNNATAGQDGSPFYETRRGGSVTLGRPKGDTLKTFLTARTESIRANNLEYNYSQLTNDEIGRIAGSIVQRGEIASGTFRLARDTRDLLTDPAGGFFFSPSVEIGTGNFRYTRPSINHSYVDDATTPNIPRVLFSEGQQTGLFRKLNLDFRRYVSLKGPRRAKLDEPKPVIATRLLVGLASGNIGFSEQYFLGGAETLRGYQDDRFWGNNLFLSSTELRLPFDKAGTLNGALFIDIGDAWGGLAINRQGNVVGYDQHSGFKPNVGFGIGIRVKTPVGPVRLDYGIGETNRTHFSIGQTF